MSYKSRGPQICASCLSANAWIKKLHMQTAPKIHRHPDFLEFQALFSDFPQFPETNKRALLDKPQVAIPNLGIISMSNITRPNDLSVKQDPERSNSQSKGRELNLCLHQYPLELVMERGKPLDYCSSHSQLSQPIQKTPWLEELHWRVTFKLHWRQLIT